MTGRYYDAKEGFLMTNSQVTIAALSAQPLAS